MLRRRLIVVLSRVALLFGLLAAPERFGDQRVGQHELGLRHLLDRQHDVGGLARGDVVAADARDVAFGAEQLAAETLAALDRDRHLDLHEIVGVALEVRLAHQRTVDAGRRQLQPVGAVHRIGGVEHRRQGARADLAVLDRHGAVGLLGHHLHGAAVGAGHAHAHQPIAEALDDGLDDGGDPGAQARLDDQARLGARCGFSRRRSFVGRITSLLMR